MDYQDLTRTFLRHDECPKCGSKNNLAIYHVEELGTETYYCHTPGCTHKRTEVDAINAQRKANVEELERMYESTDILKRPQVLWYPLVSRRITKETCIRYGVKVDAQRLEYLFPYYNSKNSLTANKVRKRDTKEFYWEGQAKSVTLFGQQIPSNSQFLIITEGEFDAMAAHQMTGYHAVSVPNGADGALKAIKANLKYVEKSFKKVYLCLDSDEPGRAASEELYQLLKPGMAANVEMRYKDANEYLFTEEGAKEFMKDIHAAPVRVLEEFWTKEQKSKLADDICNGTISKKNTENSIGICGIKELDEKFALREGEVTTIFSDPFVGKSSLARWIAANLLRQGIKVMAIPLEETSDEWSRKMAAMVIGVKTEVINSPKIAEAVKNELHDVLENDYDVVYAGMGVGDQKLEELIDYSVRGNGTKVVVLDNVSAACADDSEMHRRMTSLYSLLTRTAKDLNIHVIAVSHTKRDPHLKNGEIPSMSHGYGGSAIEKFSNNVIGLGRREDEDILKGRLMKQRFTGETCKFEVKYDRQTGCFYEKEAETENRYRQESVRSGVRFGDRATVPQEKPRTNKDTEQVQDIPDIATDNLQSRLQVSGSNTDNICGSQGVSKEGMASKNETIDSFLKAVNSGFSRKSPCYIKPPIIPNIRDVVKKEPIRLCSIPSESSSTEDAGGVDTDIKRRTSPDILRESRKRSEHTDGGQPIRKYIHDPSKNNPNFIPRGGRKT